MKTVSVVIGVVVVAILGWWFLSHQPASYEFNAHSLSNLFSLGKKEIAEGNKKVQKSVSDAQEKLIPNAKETLDSLKATTFSTIDSTAKKLVERAGMVLGESMVDNKSSQNSVNQTAPSTNAVIVDDVQKTNPSATICQVQQKSIPVKYFLRASPVQVGVYSANVAWSDDSIPENLPPLGPSGSVLLEHTYQKTGAFIITVTLTSDKGIKTTYEKTVCLL
jgi:hypothetical protein